MDLLDRLRARAAALPEVRLAVLFGSVARGQERKGSDVDLGLLVDPDTPDARLRALIELERAAGREVDLVFLDEAPPLLRFEISRDGVLLRERDEGLWTDFRVKAMLDWWDWAPYAKRIEDASIRRLRERMAHGKA
jgi:predicted nucleotidyltransferase